MLPQQLIQPRVERVTPIAIAVFDVAGGLPSQGRGRSAEDK
jgi:hypothetical protein